MLGTQVVSPENTLWLRYLRKRIVHMLVDCDTYSLRSRRRLPIDRGMLVRAQWHRMSDSRCGSCGRHSSSLSVVVMVCGCKPYAPLQGQWVAAQVEALEAMQARQLREAPEHAATQDDHPKVRLGGRHKKGGMRTLVWGG